MKRTAKFLVMLLAVVMVASAISAVAFGEFTSEISEYDKYGYYAYFDFENYDHSDHLAYLRSAAKNANGLECDPFGFVLNTQGSLHGTGEIVREGDNTYYHFVQGGVGGDYAVFGVFDMIDPSGNDAILGDSAEISFRLRMSAEQTESESKLMPIVNIRRNGDNATYLYADIYGNLYARYKTDNNAENKTRVYTNGDGMTVGGDGKFMDIAFRWYDTSNTFSVYVNGAVVAEALPFCYDYRTAAKVEKTYDDNFSVESMAIVGGTSEDKTRTLELFRAINKNEAFAYDIDDLKITRIETAQGGAVYYENSFEGTLEGLSNHVQYGSYRYPGGGESAIVRGADENGNSFLIVPSGKGFALDDRHYQAFTQDSLVIEFSICGTPTHTDGRKALIRLNDGNGSSLYKVLWVDSQGYLYMDESDENHIEGYKLESDEWLDIAIVAIKNTDNDGKFSSFATSKKSSANLAYYFNYYINGEYVGASARKDLVKFGSDSTWKDYVLTSSNHKYTVTEHDSTIDLGSLTLIDDSTTKNHKIYKSVEGGVVTYYDVTFDDEGNQTKYSTMVIGDYDTSDDIEDLRFLTDRNFDAKFDNIKIYEGTAPEFVYEAANAPGGDVVLNVDFANFNFPAKNVESRTYSKGADVLGSFITSGVNASHSVHKDENGNAVSKSNTKSTDYTTLTLNGGAWFDFFIPMPEKINGGFDFTYSFETTVKNFTFGAENAPSLIQFFNFRFENDASAEHQLLLTLDSNYNLYIGDTTTTKLYDANGQAVKLDNSVWNELRVDVRFVKDSSGGSLAATYYLNDELLYLVDGSAAENVTNIFKAAILERVGVNNLRFRFNGQIADKTTLSLDAKSFTVSSLEKSVYTTVESDQVNFGGKVTAIEFTVPKYTSEGGRYEAVSLVKNSDEGVNKLTLVVVDPATGKAFVGIGGRYYELLDSTGKAITVPQSGLPMAIVYNDVDGVARYYANRSVAYVKVGVGVSPAVDVGVYSSAFAQLGKTSDYSYTVFGGYAGDEKIMDGDDYKLKSYDMGEIDGSALIGFQDNSVSSAIRLVAGINSLYYTSVGFEIEAYENGVSQGVKDVSGNLVFDSIISNNKVVSASDLGYKYLVALAISDLPEEVSNNSYVLVRAYAAIGENKHYDKTIKLVITDDGYYFENNGTVYQNDFNEVTDIPAEWKLGGSESSITSGAIKAQLDDNGAAKFNVTVNDKGFFYLDQYVGEEYLFQFDVTVDEYLDDSSYLAPIFGYNSPSSFGYAYIRMGDYTKKGAQGAIETFDGAYDTIASFTFDQLGGLLEKGKTHTVTLTVKSNHVALFVDGSFVAEGDVASGTTEGKIGICSKGVSMTVDNVIVKTGSYAKSSYLLHEEYFNGIDALPEGWVVALGDDKSSAGVTADGELRLVQPTGSFMLSYYDTAITSDSYSVEADFTITDKQADDKYFGLVYGLSDAKNFVTTYVRFSGSNCATEVRNNGAWSNAVKFDTFGAGVSFELGETYTLKAVFEGTKVKLYIDGKYVTEADIPEGYSGGKVGFITSGVNLKIDDLCVSELPEESKTPYTINFNGITALPDEWKTAELSEGSSVTAKDNAKVVVTDTRYEYFSMWLKDGVKKNGVAVNDYVVEADVVINGISESNAFFGISFRQQGINTATGDAKGDFIIAAWRSTGKNWLEYNNSTALNNVVKSDTSAFVYGQTYTLKLVCKNNNVEFYINGNKISSGTVPSDKAQTGSVGLTTKGVSFDVLKFTVKDAENTSEVLFDSDFGSLNSLSEDWMIYSTYPATGKAELTGASALCVEDNTALEKENDIVSFVSNSYYYASMWLKDGVSQNGVAVNDYVIEANITIKDWVESSSNGYLALTARQHGAPIDNADKSGGNFIIVGTRPKDGSVWIQGNNSSNYKFGGDTIKISALEKGKTYTLKLVCQGTSLAYYIDGVLVREATINKDQSKFADGSVGILCKGTTFDLNSFTVKTVDTGKVLYEGNFSSDEVLSNEWGFCIDDSANGSVKTAAKEDKIVEVISADYNYSALWLKNGVKKDGVAVSDYVVEANVTVKDWVTTSGKEGYIGFTFRQSGFNSTPEVAGILAGLRPATGRAWIQGNNSSAYNYAGGLSDIPAVAAIKKGGTHTLKLVCSGNTFTVYVDGLEARKGTKPSDSNFNTGTVGILGRGLTFDLNSFIVKTVDTGEILYECDFDDLGALSNEWNTVVGNSSKGSVKLAVAPEKESEIVKDAIAHTYIDGVLDYSDYTVSADISIVDGSGNAAVMLRYTDEENFVAMILKPNGTVEFKCMVDGVWSDSKAYAGAVSAWTSGAKRKVKVECEGMTLTAFIDSGDGFEQIGTAYTIPSGKGFEDGTVGFGAKSLKVTVDNLVIQPIEEEEQLEVYYSQNFNMTTGVPAEWIHEEGAQRSNGFVPDISIAVRPTDTNNGFLSASAMDSTLTVIALDKLLSYDNFVYEVDVSMVERSRASGVSYYMGPVFGLQDDSTCGTITLKVTEGTFNIEAWLTNAATNGNWISFDSGIYGATAMNTTYRFRVVGSDGYLTLYVNGIEEAKCKVDDPYLDGRFGIVFRNSEVAIDNVKVFKEVKHYEVNESDYTTTTIRVATFNIGDYSTYNNSSGAGIDYGNGTATTKQQYINVMKKVGADIWGLQEDSPYFDGKTYESAYDAIYSEIYENHQGFFTSTYNGKSFLTGFELYDVEQVYYTKTSTSYGHPWFLAGKVLIEGNEVCLITVHLDWTCKIRRAQQIKDIIAYADKYKYSIILGDFNPENYIDGTKVADPNDPDYVNGSATVNMYQVDWKYFTDAGYEPANGGRFGVFGTLASAGKIKSPYPWDGIFVSSNIKIKNAKTVVESWMNDHAIFVADLEIYFENENTIGGGSDSEGTKLSTNGLDTIAGLFKSEPYIISATEDTYIHGESPSKSFGDSSELVVKGTDYGYRLLIQNDKYHRRAFIGFDISSLKDIDLDNVDRVYLELNCTDVEQDGVDTPLYLKELSASWSESSVYSDLKRASANKTVATFNVSAKGAVSVDITEYIKSAIKSGKTTISLVIDGSTNSDDMRRVNFSSSETQNGPIIKLTENVQKDYTTNLEFTGENPWQVAMDGVTEWEERWELIKANGANDADVIEKISTEYATQVGAATAEKTNGLSTKYTNYDTRLVSSLKGYTASTAELDLYDVYGGYTGGEKYEATGFFYTKKIGDRWWVIDPLGYPFFRTACVEITHGSSPNQKANTLAEYGSIGNWADAATDRLRELGFNATGGWSDTARLIKADQPLAQTSIIYVMSEYADSLGLNESDSGNTELTFDIIPSFDPAFEQFAESIIRTSVSGYSNSPYIYGWMSDNELPSNLNMLDNALALDYTDERFVYSYALAWTFMYVKTENVDVRRSDVTDELRREFRAMVFDKYYEVIREKLDKYDPNHMYLGCRLLNQNYQDEFVMRVSGYWCDVVTFNYYGVWEPESEFIANVQNWTNAPFTITEWYAKGMDVCTDDNGLTNKSGAGWTVKTQEDRGMFYQNYALKLLECKGCVGFDWFKYWDNDPENLEADLSNRDSNKGILNNSGEEYTDLIEYMSELNTQKYNLINFFDARNSD